VGELVVDADQLQAGAGVDEARDDGVPHRLRRRVELQEPADLLVAPPDQRPGLLRIDAEGLHELDQGGRLLNRIQVLPVEVLLGLGEQAPLRVGERLVDQARDLGEAGQLGSPPSSLTRDDAVVAWDGLVWPYDDWLADPGAPQALGQGQESGRVEVTSSLPLRGGRNALHAQAYQVGHGPPNQSSRRYRQAPYRRQSPEGSP
jgi:hypothetical protein